MFINVKYSIKKSNCFYRTEYINTLNILCTCQIEPSRSSEAGGTHYVSCRSHATSQVGHIIKNIHMNICRYICILQNVFFKLFLKSVTMKINKRFL